MEKEDNKIKMMYYIRTSTGEFMETEIPTEKIQYLSRDVKVFRLSNNQVIKTNNFTFYDTVKSLPEGSISGEVLWDYKEKDVTDVLVY
jgi:hypothetical protein